MKTTRNEMPVSKKILFEVFGRNNICLLSAKYCNEKRPVTMLLTEASIPPTEDFKTSLPLKVSFVSEAMKESLELMDLLNNFDKERLAMLSDIKSFNHGILCGLINIKTTLKVENDVVKISCKSEQDSKTIGERTLEFSKFEAGLPMKDFL